MLRRSWRWIALVVILGASLATVWPARLLGFSYDDLQQMRMLDAAGGLEIQLWHFGGGPDMAEELAKRVHSGEYQWTDVVPESFGVNLFRPLSSLVYSIGYAIVGRSSVGLHGMVIFLWLATLAAAFLLFQRTLPGPAGALAALVFAVAPVHSEPLLVIGAMTHFVECSVGFLALVAYARWREGGARRDGIAAFILFALAFAAQEAAFQVLAFVPAYELAVSRDPWRRRLRAVAPLIVLVFAYLLVYRWTGSSGGHGHGYVDPLHDPLLALARLLIRLPISLLCLWSHLDVSKTAGWDAVPMWSYAAAIAFLLLAVLACVRGPERYRRHLRWLLLGSLFSLPAVALVDSYPDQFVLAPRALFVPSLGVAGLVAVLALWAFEAVRERRNKAVAAALVAVGATALALHVAWAPFLLRERCHGTPGVRRQAFAARSVESLERKAVFDRSRPGFAVILHDPFIHPNVWLRFARRYGPEDKVWWNLSAPYTRETELTRRGPSSLEAHYPGALPQEAAKRPFRDGERIETALARVTILATEREYPRRVLFEFHKTLEDPSFAFLTWDKGVFQQFAPPREGSLVLSSSGPADGAGGAGGAAGGTTPSF